MERFNKERDDAKEALETIQAELATKTGERDAVREKFDAIKDRLKEYMSEHRDIRSELEKAQKTVKTLENDIEKEKEKIASADNGRHAQKMEEIQSAEEKLESMRQQVQDKSAQSRPLDAAVRDAESALQDAKDAMYNSGAAVKSIQNRIAAFEREQGDWREAYSPRLKALLSAIERETRFREKPVGPLGRYIRLLKGEWADILEKQAGGALNAFAVSHKADQGVLSDLMRRSNYDAQIFVTTTRSIDTTQQEPSEEYDTWLRALRIDNVLVRNCLVINQGIEKVVLEKDPERGRQLVIERRPGVNRVFAMNPIPGEGNSKWGYNISLTSGGNEASQPIPPWKGGARMQTDSESQVAYVHSSTLD
jgi:chromosome segregation ATPase